MSFNKNDYVNIFEDVFIKNVYNDWKVDKKSAGKDIVGKHYENFIRVVYSEMGFLPIESRTKILGSEYNADSAFGENQDKIKLILEDKGHYLDSTFLTRAMTNASHVFLKCIKQNIDTPYFIIDCPTKYSKYEYMFNELKEVYKECIQEILDVKFKYLYVCEHDRIESETYFASSSNPFVLDEKLIEQKLEFLYSIKDSMTIIQPTPNEL